MPHHTPKADLSDLTLLGRDATRMEHKLEAFPNRHPGRDYVVTLHTSEFTCLCPATGQPDFATITIRYIPEEKIVESKSLKLYFMGYRNRGVFHEHLSNIILDDLVAVLQPRWCRVEGRFNSRGGIAIEVVAEHNPEKRPSGLLPVQA